MDLENKFNSTSKNTGYLGVDTDFYSHNEINNDSYLGVNTDFDSASNTYSTQDIERNYITNNMINRGISSGEQALLLGFIKYGLRVDTGYKYNLLSNVLGGDSGFNDDSFTEMILDASVGVLIGGYASKAAMNMGINALFLSIMSTDSYILLLSATIGTALIVEVGIIVGLSGAYAILKHEFKKHELNPITNFLQPAHRDLELNIYNLYNINFQE